MIAEAKHYPTETTLFTYIVLEESSITLVKNVPIKI